MAIDPTGVAQLANADAENTDLPGLSAFTGAWTAFQDFTGLWAANMYADVTAFRDYVSSYTGVNSR